MYLYFFASEGLQFTKCVLKKTQKKAAEGKLCNFVLVFSLYIPVPRVLPVPFFTEVFNDGRVRAVPF